MKTLAYQTIDVILESEASTSAKLLAVALYSFQNRKTGLCNPSVRTLAMCISSSPTTVQKALKELVSLEMIEWSTSRQRFDKFNSNNYTLHYTVPDTDTVNDTVVDTPVDSVVDTSETGTEPREPTKPSKPNKRKKHEYEKEYSEFYSKYPRKVSKKLGEESWKRLREEGKLLSLDEMLRVLEEYSTAHNWSEREANFIPHISTWLNEERFSEQVSQLSEDDRAMVDDVKNNAVDRFNSWMEEKRKMQNA